MDKNRFDGFTRQLAQRENRRQAIKTLLAGGAGTAAALMIGKETEAAKPPSTAVDCCPASAPKLCGSPLTCTPVATDPNNCGACGVTCGTGQTCVAGVCTSPSVKCRKVADCASGNTECRTATTCKGSVCGYSYIPNNTPAGTQTTGDCKTQVCDGAGNIVTIADPNDTPTPQNDCYTGICDGSNPVQQAKEPRDACSGGMCDGNGTCVQCLQASDCSPGANECQEAACVSGVCEIINVADGHVTGQQVGGDCSKNVCDGTGKIVSVTDTNDRPADQDLCHFGSCDGNLPVQRPKTLGARCSASGDFCDGNGNCVECTTASDCGPSTNECQTVVCRSGACEVDNVDSGHETGQQTLADCMISVCDGNGGTRLDPADDPPAGVGVCLPSYICDDGTAVPQYASTTTVCTGGYCDGIGNCVTCNTNDQCPAGPGFSMPVCSGDHTCGYTCNPGFRGCPGGSDCAVNVLSDINNCGACGQRCNPQNATGTCNNGNCLVATCNTGYANCDGNHANGCEVDLSRDNNNCGTCGNVCTNGRVCASGTCVVPFN